MKSTLHLAGLALALSAFSALAAPPALTLRAIHAMAFDPATGSVRKGSNLFDPAQTTRSYVFEDPAHRTRFAMGLGTPVTYIDVELGLAGTEIADGATLEFRAKGKDSKKPVMTQKVYLAPYGMQAANGVLHVPFIVYDESCDELELTATLSDGKKTLAHQSRTIPFACAD